MKPSKYTITRVFSSIRSGSLKKILALGVFERVGSTLLMDTIDKYGRGYTEPFKLHFEYGSLYRSSNEGYRQYFLNSIVYAQQYHKASILKETNLYYELPLLLKKYNNYDLILILTRNINGIVSSFKKNNLYEMWNYDNEVKHILQSKDYKNSKYRIFDLINKNSWIEKIVCLIAINTQIIYENVCLMKDLRYGILNYQATLKGKSFNKTSTEGVGIFNTNKVKIRGNDWQQVLNKDELYAIDKALTKIFKISKAKDSIPIDKIFSELEMI